MTKRQKRLRTITAAFALLALLNNVAMACDGSFECEFKAGGETRNICTRLANHQVKPTEPYGGWLTDSIDVATITKVCAAKFNIKFSGSDDVLRTWCNEIGNPKSEETLSWI
jgi:hypothetical protein